MFTFGQFDALVKYFQGLLLPTPLDFSYGIDNGLKQESTHVYID